MAESVGSVINNLAGEEIELDFPIDRLARKIGTYLPTFFAAILIAGQVSDPMKCAVPSDYNPEQYMFLASYCGKNLSGNGTDGTSFGFLPLLLVIQAFLAYVPYFFCHGLTQSTIGPIMKEAKEMTILTSLDITIDNTEIGDKKTVRDEDGMPIRGNQEEQEDSESQKHVSLLQRNLEHKITAKVRVFVGQRLKAISGKYFSQIYFLCILALRFLIAIITYIIIVPPFLNTSDFLRPNFPTEATCKYNASLLFVENSTEMIETTCVIPINTYAAIVWYVDLAAIGVITMLPICWYIYYWKVKFQSDILAAEVLVPEKQKYRFTKLFVPYVFSKKDDDILLILALIITNVDKYITYKILSAFCDMARIDEEEDDDEVVGDVRLEVNRNK